MFSVMSVGHSVHGGPHVTITHDALDLPVEPPPFLDMRHWSPSPSPGPRPVTLVAITGDRFKLVGPGYQTSQRSWHLSIK